jgi:excisionase family DNA binding protein
MRGHRHRRSTLYELIRSGQLESVSIGRTRLIPADALDAFVARLRRRVLSMSPHRSDPRRAANATRATASGQDDRHDRTCQVGLARGSVTEAVALACRTRGCICTPHVTVVERGEQAHVQVAHDDWCPAIRGAA